MHTQTYSVKGMHCASCSSIIEKTFRKVAGVQSAEVNYGTEKAKFSFDPAKTNAHDLSKYIEPLGYSLEVPMTAQEMGMSESEHHKGTSIFLEQSTAKENWSHAAHTGLGQSKQEKLAEVADMRTKVMVAIPLAIFSIIVMGWDILAQFGVVSEMSTVMSEFVHHLLPIFATYILFVVGKPYLLGFYRFLRFGKANMDTLIGIGTSVAFLYSFIVTAFEEPLRQFINVEHTYYDVTVVVIAFITLGKYLEVKAKIKTGDAIEKLLNLQAKTAIIIKDGKEKEISVDQVMRDDRLVVKPGARISVDGVVVEGASFVDESMVTGESMPIEKKAGDAVVA